METDPETGHLALVYLNFLRFHFYEIVKLIQAVSFKLFIVTSLEIERTELLYGTKTALQLKTS